MFDTILGLPLHPLVVHGVVVLLPLMAVATVVVTLRATWRARLAWWVVAGNLAVAAMAYVARESGEHLLRDLAGLQIETHESFGEALPFFAIGLLAWSVVVAALRRSTRAGALLTIGSILVAAATLYWTVRTGHSGAEAVWGS